MHFIALSRGVQLRHAIACTPQPKSRYLSGCSADRRVCVVFARCSDVGADQFHRRSLQALRRRDLRRRLGSAEENHPRGILPHGGECDRAPRGVHSGRLETSGDSQLVCVNEREGGGGGRERRERVIVVYFTDNRVIIIIMNGPSIIVLM